MNKKQEVEKQTAAFDAAFKERFKNSAGRITRTPFHVMSFLSGCWTIPHVAAFEHVRGKAIESYDRYCRRRGITRTWRNAVEFYIRGRIG